MKNQPHPNKENTMSNKTDKNVSLALELNLTKIVDAIQVPVTYKSGKVSGGGVIQLAISEGFMVPVAIKPILVFQKDQVGVIFSTQGNLLVLVAYYSKTMTAAMFLIDSSKLTAPVAELVAFDMGLKQVVDSLKSGVVSSYAYKGEWTPLPLAA
jgi:hypothetical protein